MPHRFLRTAVLLLVSVLGVGLLAGSATGRPVSPPVPFPAKPVGLPAPVKVGDALDTPAPWQPQGSCAAEPLPGTVKLRNLILKTYGRGYDGGTIRSCVVGEGSEHKDGRAWDWMLDLSDRRDRRAAGDFLAWVTRNDGAVARRLGIMYVIYNKRMWSTWDGAWETYDGYSPHTDHVHISLGWNGARGLTSFWTGRTWALDHGTCTVFRRSPAKVAGKKPQTSACPAAVEPARALGRPMLWLGSSGDHVRAAQRALGSTATGTFDTATRARVLRFQRHHDLPRTGAVDRATWAALLPDKARSLHPEWTPAQAREWAREVAGSPTLKRGSAGKAVTALQASLGLPVAQRTGYFGRRTRKLVAKVRRANGSRGADVDRAMWRMLG